MKKNKVLAILILILSLYNYNQAVIESCALFTQDDKKILILGDYHGCLASEGSILHESDKRDNSIIMSDLKRIADNNIPTTVILEAAEWDINHKEFLRYNDYMGMYYNLPFYAKDNAYKIGKNIRFEFGDVRTRALRNFIELFSVVDQYKTPEMWLILPEQLKKLFNADDSLNDWLYELDLITNDLLSKAKSTNSKKLIEYVEHSLNKINKIREILNLYCNKEELIGSFIDFFANKMVTRNLDFLKKLCYECLMPISNKVLDIGFFINLIDSLKIYKQIICFAGNNHAIALHKFLKYLGFNMNFIEGRTTKDKNAASFQEPRFTEHELIKLLRKSFNDNISENFCSYCGVSQEKLSRCGACKNIYYCSRSCQSKDWSKHKLICKK